MTPAGTEPDDVLELLSGDVNPAAGRVTLDGADVRTPELTRQLFYVPDEAEALSASLMELLRAVAPDITAARAAELADAVSLDHIVSLPHGVEERLGPGGAELTVSERQRLMLAIAIAAEPRVLLVGSLLALADVDSALPLIGVLRAGARSPRSSACAAARWPRPSTSSCSSLAAALASAPTSSCSSTCLSTPSCGSSDCRRPTST